ncbi:MAG: DUF2236 domain-containing protein [Phycisphaeraceae bacterium]|nr:DUF2236 domain-containing protein [Phycisphaeraceae bacterium]
MATSTSHNRSSSAWQDRWSQPTVKDLIDGIGSLHRGGAKILVERIGKLEGVDASLVWYGPSWKWTVQYSLPSTSKKPAEVLCYLVPRQTGPMICVPLTESQMEALKARRLRKFVRDGLEAARRSVQTYWGVWTFATDGEAELLCELVRRKHTLATGQPAMGDDPEE